MSRRLDFGKNFRNRQARYGLNGARLCQGFNVHLRIGPGTSIPLGWMWFRASWHSSTLLKGTDKEM
jgi:hypothetical protein